MVMGVLSVVQISGVSAEVAWLDYLVPWYDDNSPLWLGWMGLFVTVSLFPSARRVRGRSQQSSGSRSEPGRRR